MKRTDAFPSSYLKQEDLPRPPGTMHATIEDVRTETMPSDDKAEKPVMYFANGSTKPMVLNGGNWDLLEAAYGEDSDSWRGKPIELYVDPNVMYAGRRTGGIRVRIASNGTGWMLQQALDACGAAGVDKEQLKAAITEAGGTGWNAARDTPIAQRLIAAASPSIQEHAPIDESDIPF